MSTLTRPRGQAHNAEKKGNVHPQQPPSWLHPRVAVVLGIGEEWHYWLFVCRLFSIAPAVWWGFPTALRVLLRVQFQLLAAAICDKEGHCLGAITVWNIVVTFGEHAHAFMALVWCGVSAYLSFFFCDCVMSRALLNYGAKRTLPRVLVVNFSNFLVTNVILNKTGCWDDASRLVLPTWMGIATTLTVLYHVLQRNINIRKETWTSMSIFSVASYTSLVILLLREYMLDPSGRGVV